jgi:hypothetical protein
LTIDGVKQTLIAQNGYVSAPSQPFMQLPQSLQPPDRSTSQRLSNSMNES